MNLRIPAAAAVALTLALAPAAQAAPDKFTLETDVFVCNTASINWQGDDLYVLDSDKQGFVHFKDGLRVHNNDNENAAQHSKALALCGEGEGTDLPPVEGGAY